MVRKEQRTQSSNKEQVLKKTKKYKKTKQNKTKTISIKLKCVCCYLRKRKSKCGKASNRAGIKRKRLIYG